MLFIAPGVKNANAIFLLFDDQTFNIEIVQIKSTSLMETLHSNVKSVMLDLKQLSKTSFSCLQSADQPSKGLEKSWFLL